MNMQRRIPTEYGDGAISATPRIVAQLAAERVLLVCGQQSFEASGAAVMLPNLERAAEVTRWSDFSPNTDAQDLAKGLSVVADSQPDLILGVGGGSAMDMAKLLCAYDGTPEDALLAAVAASTPITSRRRRLVLAPTTSGSGSQVTHFAVVYIGDDKYSIAGPAMYPDRIVLDPLLPISSSSHQRATSGIDAVCQATESLWAVSATDASRRRARRALSLLLPAIESFAHEPGPSSARAMCLGSHLAGQAIDVSKTTAAHALSYAITKRYGVDHGNAVALSFGPLLELHATADDADLQTAVDPELFRAVIDHILVRLGADDGTTAHHKFRALIDRLGLVSSLEAAGLRGADEVERLASAVNAERLGNNPVRLSHRDLTRVLDAARAVR